MSEETPADPQQTGSESGKDHSSRLLIGGSIFVVILVMGIIVSIVIAMRDGDGPLVPAGDQSTGATAKVEPNKFEQDPFFDELGHVVYVPLNDAGVVLAQSAPGSGRSDTVAPSGLMLQRVHGNMYLPFSTSDGPTGFSDNGVAKGFSRSAQGAGLAAIHYMGYLASGNNRIKMVQDAGVVDDPNGVLAERMKFNSSKQQGAVPDNFAARTLPMIKVNYTSDLARVHIGVTTTLKDGRTQNADVWVDLVWRDDSGWVVKIRDAIALGAKAVADYADGWTSWW